jgi:hypothetical protein
LNAKSVLTKRLPGWLQIVDGKIKPVPERVRIIRRIFKMVLDGHGFGVIPQTLNREGVKCFTHGKRWSPTYVQKICSSRALLGELQPHRITKTEDGRWKRLPFGDPIPDYYPRIIDEDTFKAAAGILSLRRKTETGPRNAYVNLFKGLIFDAHDKSVMMLVDKGYGRRYASTHAVLKMPGASPYVTIPVVSVEVALVSWLGKQTDMTGSHRTNADDAKLLAVQGRLADVRDRTKEIQETLATTKGVCSPIRLVTGG